MVKIKDHAPLIFTFKNKLLEASVSAKVLQNYF